MDGTVGAGGHAVGILEASKPDGLLLGLDVDPQALELAFTRLSAFGSRVVLKQASYTTLCNQLALLGWAGVDGIILDLGISSMQIDTPERGFSFLSDAPLDMRFDPKNPLQASDLVNHLPEKELAALIFEYGEERWAREVARAIVKSRPISTTGALSDVIVHSIGNRYAKVHLHPATRTFQALRIAVNRELEAIQEVLPQALQALNPGGRLAVIAFHSLEDRVVKGVFRRESRDCICPPRQPICTCGHRATVSEINRRPIQPDEAEIQQNPRARSAKLRIIEKLIQ